MHVCMYVHMHAHMYVCEIIYLWVGRTFDWQGPEAGLPDGTSSFPKSQFGYFLNGKMLVYFMPIRNIYDNLVHVMAIRYIWGQLV
jgi:hypothetical protein